MTARYVGYNPPWTGGSQRIMSQQQDDRLISNDILQNLLILPGELPFRPGFGVNLRNFTFEKMTDNALAQLKQNIYTNLVSNDPRLIIRTLDVVPDADASTLAITLIVSLKEDPDHNIEIKRLVQTLTRT